MTNLTLTEVRQQLGDLVTAISYQGDRVVITRNGKPQAVLVSVEDAELLSRIEDKIDLESARQALEDNNFTPWEKVKEDLGLK